MNSAPSSGFTDLHGRRVTYLRVSLTDRCNLRCFYCRAGAGFNFLPHQDVLRYEELYGLLAALPAYGVRKVRLTGGEPLVRRDLLPFLEKVLALDLDVRLTTNGTLLAPLAPTLASLGLKRVNISLDTLRRKIYEEITGHDAYLDVRQAIEASLAAGFRVKLNAVAMRGVNDADLPGFLKLATELPIELRFIEFMPMGGNTAWRQESFWPATEILAAAKEHAELDALPQEPFETAGPARRWAIRGGLGSFGLIAPLSDHFCGSCNRLRLTCDGRLRTCLYSDKEYRLRPLLRHPKLGVPAALRAIDLASRAKPFGYKFLDARRANAGVCETVMSGIGG